MSFMRYLANGKQVSFDSIENDILYAVDKGSVVKDYMGYVKEDYNFDFDHLDQLTVGGKALSMYKILKDVKENNNAKIKTLF